MQEYWKTANTPLAEGNRIQYNFVKPHMALEGKTPAEASGIRVEGTNRWLTLLEKARKRGRLIFCLTFILVTCIVIEAMLIVYHDNGGHDESLRPTLPSTISFLSW